MFTNAQQVLYFLLTIHCYLVVRFCAGSIVRPANRPYSLGWFVFVALLPFVGYFIYYRRYISNRSQDSLES
jgi:hypothetical protein